MSSIDKELEDIEKEAGFTKGSYSELLKKAFKGKYRDNLDAYGKDGGTYNAVTIGVTPNTWTYIDESGSKFAIGFITIEDGDTIYIFDANKNGLGITNTSSGEKLSQRLWGLNTAEMKDPHGIENSALGAALFEAADGGIIKNAGMAKGGTAGRELVDISLQYKEHKDMSYAAAMLMAGHAKNTYPTLNEAIAFPEGLLISKDSGKTAIDKADAAYTAITTKGDKRESQIPGSHLSGGMQPNTKEDNNKTDTSKQGLSDNISTTDGSFNKKYGTLSNRHNKIRYDYPFKIGDVLLNIPPTHITISQLRSSYDEEIIGFISRNVPAFASRIVIKVNTIFNNVEDINDSLKRIIVQFTYCPINIIHSKDLFEMLAGKGSWLDKSITRDTNGYIPIPVTMDEYTVYTIEGHPNALGCSLQFSLCNYTAYFDGDTDQSIKYIKAKINEEGNLEQEGDKGTDITTHLEDAIHPYNLAIEHILQDKEGMYPYPDNSELTLTKLSALFNPEKQDMYEESGPIKDSIVILHAESISSRYVNNFAWLPVAGYSAAIPQYIGPGSTTVAIHTKINVTEKEKTYNQNIISKLLKTYNDTTELQSREYNDDRYIVSSGLTKFVGAQICSIADINISTIANTIGTTDVNIILRKSQYIETASHLSSVSEYDNFYDLRRLSKIVESSDEIMKRVSKELGSSSESSYTNRLFANNTNIKKEDLLQPVLDIIDSAYDNLSDSDKGIIDKTSNLADVKGKGTNDAEVKADIIKIMDEYYKNISTSNTNDLRQVHNALRSLGNITIKDVEMFNKLLTKYHNIIYNITIQSIAITYMKQTDDSAKLRFLQQNNNNDRLRSTLPEYPIFNPNYDKWKNITEPLNKTTIISINFTKKDGFEQPDFIKAIRDFKDNIRSKTSNGVKLGYNIHPLDGEGSIPEDANDVTINIYPISFNEKSGVQAALTKVTDDVENKKLATAIDYASQNLGILNTIKPFAAHRYYPMVDSFVKVSAGYSGSVGDWFYNNIAHSNDGRQERLRNIQDSIKRGMSWALNTSAFRSFLPSAPQVADGNPFDVMSALIYPSARKEVPNTGNSNNDQEIRKAIDGKTFFAGLGKKVIGKSQTDDRLFTGLSEYMTIDQKKDIRGIFGTIQTEMGNKTGYNISDKDNNISKYASLNYANMGVISTDNELNSRDQSTPSKLSAGVFDKWDLYNATIDKTYKYSGIYRYMSKYHGFIKNPSIDKSTPPVAQNTTAQTPQTNTQIPQTIDQKLQIIFAAVDKVFDGSNAEVIKQYIYLSKDSIKDDSEINNKCEEYIRNIKVFIDNTILNREPEYTVTPVQISLNKCEVNIGTLGEAKASGYIRAVNPAKLIVDSKKINTQTDTQSGLKNKYLQLIADIYSISQAKSNDTVPNGKRKNNGIIVLPVIGNETDKLSKIVNTVAKLTYENYPYDETYSKYENLGQRIVDKWFEEFGKVSKDAEIQNLIKEYTEIESSNGPKDDVSAVLKSNYMASMPSTFGLQNAFPTYKLYIIQSRTSDIRFHALDAWWDFRLVQDLMVIKSKDNPIHLLKCRVSIDQRFMTTNTMVPQNSNPRILPPEHQRVAQGAGLDDALNTMYFLQGKAPVRTGMRICLKLGYHTDPRFLDTVFIGTITSLRSAMDQTIYELEAEGDGRELSVPCTQSPQSISGINYAEIIAKLLKSNPAVAHFGRLYGTTIERYSKEHTILFGLMKCAVGDNANDIKKSITTALTGTGGAIVGTIGLVVGSPVAVTLGGIAAVGAGLYSGYKFFSYTNNVALGNVVDNRIGQNISQYLTKGSGKLFNVEEWKNAYTFDARKQMEQISKMFTDVYKYGNDPIDDNIWAVDIWNTFSNIGNETLDFNNKMSIWQVLESIKRLYPDYALDVRPYGSRSTLYFGNKDWLMWRTDDPVLAMMPQIDEASDEKVVNYIGNNFKKAFETNSLLYKKNSNSSIMPSMVPFQRYHIANSKSNIIVNAITSTPSRGWNAVIVNYDEGEEQIYLKANAELYPTVIRERVFDVNFKTSEQATQYALGALREGVEKMYGGTLVLTGNAKIEPYDRVYVCDFTNKMFGWIEVETVIHKFDLNNGFTTHIVPNMVCATNSDAYKSYDDIVRGMLFKNSTMEDNLKALGMFAVGTAAGAITLAGLATIGAPVTAIGLTLFALSAGSALTGVYKGVRRLLDQYGGEDKGGYQYESEDVLAIAESLHGHVFATQMMREGLYAGAVVKGLSELYNKGGKEGIAPAISNTMSVAYENTFKTLARVITKITSNTSWEATNSPDRAIALIQRIANIKNLPENIRNLADIKIDETVAVDEKIKTSKEKYANLKAEFEKLSDTHASKAELKAELERIKTSIEGEVGSLAKRASVEPTKLTDNTKKIGTRYFRGLGSLVVMDLVIRAIEAVPMMLESYLINSVTKGNCITIKPLWHRNTMMLAGLDGWQKSNAFLHAKNVFINAKNVFDQLNKSIDYEIPRFAQTPFPSTQGAQATSNDATVNATKAVNKNPVASDMANKLSNARQHSGEIANALNEIKKTNDTPCVSEGLSEKWITAIIAQESGGNTTAVSTKKARGLMQVHEGTWFDNSNNKDALEKAINVQFIDKNDFITKMKDPTINIKAGTWIYANGLRAASKKVIEKHGNSAPNCLLTIKGGLALYNGGDSALNEYLNKLQEVDIQKSETRDFIEKVINFFNMQGINKDTLTAVMDFSQSKTARQNPEDKYKELKGQLQTDFLSACQEYAKLNNGEKIIVTSLYRTYKEQKELYDEEQRKNKGSKKVANPDKGDTPHMLGNAIDMDSNQASKMDRQGLFDKYNLYRPMWGRYKTGDLEEQWHVQSLTVMGKQKKPYNGKD